MDKNLMQKARKALIELLAGKRKLEKNGLCFFLATNVHGYNWSYIEGACDHENSFYRLISCKFGHGYGQDGVMTVKRKQLASDLIAYFEKELFLSRGKYAKRDSKGRFCK